MQRTLLLPLAIIAAPAAARTPEQAMADLFAADRAFAAASAERAPADALAAMAAPDIVMPMRQGLVSGREAVFAALRANPNYQGSGMSWRPGVEASPLPSGRGWRPRRKPGEAG